jgi:hypothetical protein
MISFALAEFNRLNLTRYTTHTSFSTLSETLRLCGSALLLWPNPHSCSLHGGRRVSQN